MKWHVGRDEGLAPPSSVTSTISQMQSCHYCQGTLTTAVTVTSHNSGLEQGKAGTSVVTEHPSHVLWINHTLNSAHRHVNRASTQLIKMQGQRKVRMKTEMPCCQLSQYPFQTSCPKSAVTLEPHWQVTPSWEHPQARAVNSWNWLISSSNNKNWDQPDHT